MEEGKYPAQSIISLYLQTLSLCRYMGGIIKTQHRRCTNITQCLLDVLRVGISPAWSFENLSYNVKQLQGILDFEN